MVKLELRFIEGLETQRENAVAPSFSMRPHRHLGSQFVVETYRRNPRVEVVEGEGAEACVRCLHFVLPLAEFSLALKVPTRDLCEICLLLVEYFTRFSFYG